MKEDGVTGLKDGDERKMAPGRVATRVFIRIFYIVE